MTPVGLGGWGRQRLSWATHGHSGLTSPLWRPLSAGVPTLLAPSVPPVLAPSTLSPGLGSPTCLSKVSSSRSLLTCPLHCRAVLLSSAGWHCRLCAVPTSFYPNPGYGWRRQWQPTPVLLPGNSHGRRSLVGCSPSCHEESDATERLHFHFSLSCIGEGNGSPLQCSSLESPSNSGAWWAAVYGVTQSRTRLKRLSSSSRVMC